MDKYASRPAGLSLGQPYFMGCLVPAERQPTVFTEEEDESRGG